MTTLREQLTEAVLALITGLENMPVPVRGEDDPRADVYVALTAAPPLVDHFLALLDEGCPAREGCPPVLGAGGVLYDWNLKLIVAYSVRTIDAEARKAQRDAGVAALTAALLPAGEDETTRRQLGGLATWFWIEPTELPNDVYDGDVLLGIARLPLTIWFTAANPSA